MIKWPSILIAFFLILFCACNGDKKSLKENTPSRVTRVWLENYYHHNDYDLAKQYSTAETAAMIDTIKGMIFPDQEGIEKLPFKIKGIRCAQPQGGTTAKCTCTYLEAENSFTEEISLVQQNGQWLVSAIEEAEDMLKDKDIEKMTQDFEKNLDRMLEQ